MRAAKKSSFAIRISRSFPFLRRGRWTAARSSRCRSSSRKIRARTGPTSACTGCKSITLVKPACTGSGINKDARTQPHGATRSPLRSQSAAIRRLRMPRRHRYRPFLTNLRSRDFFAENRWSWCRRKPSICACRQARSSCSKGTSTTRICAPKDHSEITPASTVLPICILRST